MRFSGFYNGETNNTLTHPLFFRRFVSAFCFNRTNPFKGLFVDYSGFFCPGLIFYGLVSRAFSPRKPGFHCIIMARLFSFLACTALIVCFSSAGSSDFSWLKKTTCWWKNPFSSLSYLEINRKHHDLIFFWVEKELGWIFHVWMVFFSGSVGSSHGEWHLLQRRLLPRGPRAVQTHDHSLYGDECGLQLPLDRTDFEGVRGWKSWSLSGLHCKCSDFVGIYRLFSGNFFRVQQGRGVLTLANLTVEDFGAYTCRADCGQAGIAAKTFTVYREFQGLIDWFDLLKYSVFLFGLDWLIRCTKFQ